jgi:hypothetical protein
MQISEAYFFYKSVLRKVSFHPDLFKKELNKAISSLPLEEGSTDGHLAILIHIRNFFKVCLSSINFFWGNDFNVIKLYGPSDYAAYCCS